MERLTIEKYGELLIKYNDGEYRSPCFGCESINECNPEKRTCGFYKALEKLKEYEYLEEQCIKDTTFGFSLLLIKWKQFLGHHQELYEYRKLEKQGKLLKLPYAVGDTVYSLRIDNSTYMMNSEKVWGIVEKKFELRDFEYIGKSVFPTREEAETALIALEKIQQYRNIEHKTTFEWIPCSERLPEEPDPELSDMDVFPEYIVMIEDEELPTVLEYFGHGKWYREGIYYRVVAWMPLPEPYILQEMT